MPAPTTDLALPPSWLPDPFTAVYNRLAGGLLAHGGFVAAIGGATHFVSMAGTANEDFRKFDEQVKPEDLPEFTIIQSAWKPRLFASSMHAEITQSYDCVATLETLSVKQLNLVKTHTLVALASLPDTLGFVEEAGQGQLVKTFDVMDCVDDAFGQKEWKRGTMRYVSMVRINVQLVVARRLLKSLFQPQV